MAKIVWVRLDHNADEVTSLEQLTGMSVVAAGERPAEWKPLSTRTAVLIIELPLASNIVAQLIEEAQSAEHPVPIVMLDQDSILDESVIKPAMTPFLHITEPQTIEQLARVVLTAHQDAQNAQRNRGVRANPGANC